MNIKHITSETLRNLLELTEKKEQLIKAVADVENQISKALSGTASAVLDVAEAVTPFKPKKAPAKRTSSGGSTKERVLALLEAAGDQGLRVREIADKLGTKVTNISVWFSTTGKDITTRLGPGHFAAKKVTGSAAKPEAPKVASKPAPKAPAKRKMSTEARAKIAAAAKARWEKVKAAKAPQPEKAPAVAKPAKPAKPAKVAKAAKAKAAPKAKAKK